MTRRFPRDVELSISKLKPECHGHESLSGAIGSTVYCDGSCRAGHAFELRWADGTFIADGESPGSKHNAREAAWRALEECGVVVDA